MTLPLPIPLSLDWKTWARQLSTALTTALDNVRWKTNEDSPAQNGTLLWDETTKQPVISLDGVWRPLAFGDDMEKYDAFGRMRVSNPETIFDSQMQYDLQPLLWVEKTAGAGATTHAPLESAADMAVGTASGDSVIRQTREFFRYQAGKSQQIVCTGVLGTSQANTNKLIGYGETENGVFFGQDGGGTYVLLRSSGSDTRKVYQADWSEDIMDGSGTSGITADWTKTQIFTIDLGGFGVGQVRMGLVVAGEFITAHRFLNANLETTTYMTTANLPIRYEITNTGAAAGAASLKQICSQVSTEGGMDNLQAFPFAAGQNAVNIPNGQGNATMLFAQRQQLTFNSIENRGLFQPSGFEILATGGTVYVETHYQPTPDTTETWAAVDAASFMDTSTDIGTGYTDGVIVGRAIAAAGSAGGRNSSGGTETRGFTGRLPFGLDIDGADPVILGYSFYALTNGVTADINFFWKEIR